MKRTGWISPYDIPSRTMSEGFRVAQKRKWKRICWFRIESAAGPTWTYSGHHQILLDALPREAFLITTLEDGLL